MQENEIEISVMNMSNLNEIKDILESEFDDFWNYKVFKSEIENPNSIYFVAKSKDEIIGFVGVLLIIDTAEITNIVVKKSFRGKRYI
ncbi:MAG: GNAT family N-acetyltransferase [Clostridia bacterium]|nr:GNAT family N-acetyltransferase [Clostridia bacterium]